MIYRTSPNPTIISRNLYISFCLSVGSDVKQYFVSGGNKYVADINDDNELVNNDAYPGLQFRKGECRYCSSFGWR